MVIAELNGAKTYMSEDGIIGLTHYLRNLSDSQQPKLFVLNGGVLPEMPTNRGGERNKDQLRVVQHGVSNLDDAAAVMKIHMERLFGALPGDSQVVYVMGKADRKNLDSIKLDLSNLYLDAVRNLEKKQGRIDFPLEPKIEATEKGIESRKEILESLKGAEAALTRRIAEATDQAQADAHREQLGKVRENERINREELREFEERKGLLETLRHLTFAELPRYRIKDRMNETKQKMAEVGQQLDEALSGTPEYESLEREIKTLGNRMRALQKRYNESADGETARNLMAKQARIHKFTGNIPLPKNANDIVDMLAKSYYMTNLRDALGRKRHVTVQEGGLEVYERKINGFEFNVVVTNGLREVSSMYSINSNNRLIKRAYALTRGNGGEAKLDGTPLNVLIGGRTIFTSFSIDPWVDQSKTLVAALSKGPFIDTEKNTLAYLNGIRNDETRMLDKDHVPDSSVSIITVSGDGSIAHRTLKEEKLRDERIKDDLEEVPALERVLKRFEGGKWSADEAKSRELGEALLRAKRPSEIKDEDLAYASRAVLQGTVPNAGKQAPRDVEELSFVQFTDTHVGSSGNVALLRAAAAEALQRKPDIVFLTGDIIEGNYHNYMNTQRPQKETDIDKEFEKWLRSKGYGEEVITSELLTFYRRQRLNAISNIDAQPKVFIEPMQDLLLDTIARGGYIAIVSGNHYNKTDGKSERDEATALKSHIVLFLEGVAAGKGMQLPEDWRGHIMTGSGSDLAAETFTFNGVEFEVRHSLGKEDGRVSNFLSEKRSDAKVVLYGHLHSAREISNVTTEAVQAPAMQDGSTCPFVKTISVPITPDNKLTGYGADTLKIRDGRVLEHTLEFRFKDQLGVVDSLFNQFLQERRMGTVATRKVKA